MIFQSQHPEHVSWLCVSFDSDDLIHLINAPRELINSILETFKDKIKKCNQEFISGIFEIQFKDTPWSQSSSKIQSKLVLLDLLQCLEQQGFSLRATLDLDHGKGGDSYKSSGETWFCSGGG